MQNFIWNFDLFFDVAKCLTNAVQFIWSKRSSKLPYEASHLDLHKNDKLESNEAPNNSNINKDDDTDTDDDFILAEKINQSLYEMQPSCSTPPPKLINCRSLVFQVKKILSPRSSSMPQKETFIKSFNYQQPDSEDSEDRGLEVTAKESGELYFDCPTMPNELSASKTLSESEDFLCFGEQVKRFNSTYKVIGDCFSNSAL